VSSSLKINVISESQFTVQGHGVHSAFVDTVDALREYTHSQVQANGQKRADLVHIHTVGPYALSKLLFSQGAKIVSAHVLPDSFVGSLIGTKYWLGLATWYLRWFYNRADAVIAVSDEVSRELTLMGVKKPIYMVPNMVRSSMFSVSPGEKAKLRHELDIPANAFVVLGCGQVQPRKRVDTFVKVAGKVPSVRFIWVGGMPFKRLAASSASMDDLMAHHPDNVTFTGLLPREDTVKYFKAADLFFLPSAQETFGLVIVEAAAAGLPVVLRDLTVYKQLFDDDYIPGDDASFADIIEKAISDHAYYAKWRQASLRIAERYDTQRGAQKLMGVYEEVLAKQESHKNY
jgi:1,2-diacylglycerol-3-alpha-glucose alpha-1,2-galactosyltransferase